MKLCMCCKCTRLQSLEITERRVFINRAENLEDLKGNIRRKIRAISPAMLRSVMNNVLVRARLCTAVEGQQLRDIIFSS